MIPSIMINHSTFDGVEQPLSESIEKGDDLKGKKRYRVYSQLSTIFFIIDYKQNNELVHTIIEIIIFR